MGSYGTSSHIYTVDYKMKGDKNKTVRRTTNVGMYLESGDRAHCACSHSITKFQQSDILQDLATPKGSLMLTVRLNTRLLAARKSVESKKKKKKKSYSIQL